MWPGRRPLRRPPAGLRRRHRPLGRLEADVARGLALRHDWDPSTARPTSPAPWPGWASATTRRSWVNPRPTAAPNPGSAPSRSSACGSSCTTPSRSSARPWPASSSATTAPGSSNGTATRLRRRPISQLKRQQRHDQVGTTSVQETGRCSVRQQRGSGSGLVGQPGDPLGTQHRREPAQHAWQALGRHHGHAMCDHLAPGDLGAVNGHDRHHHRRRTASSAGATTRAVAGDGIGRWSGPSPNCQIASETDQ